MAVPILNNRYVFPFGYRGYVAFSTGAYVPWNGFDSGASTPNSSILGAVMQFVTSGAPTDKQTLVFFGPDGTAYRFQFLYAATVGDQSNAIEVRLPNSGSSTAAQVMTALSDILILTQASTEGGTLVKFPWTFQGLNATTSRVNFTSNGNVAPSVTPTNMVVSVISQPVIGKTGISTSKSICAVSGPCGAFLPGP